MRISSEVRSRPPVFSPRFGLSPGYFYARKLTDAVMFNRQITGLKSIVRAQSLRGEDYLRMG